MKKIWYIKINHIEEGPFSVQELKQDRRITPDTLVWKEGFTTWVPMRKVAELKEVFKDEPEPKSLNEEKELTSKNKTIQDDKGALVLNPSYDFIPFLFWLLVILIVITYVLIQLDKRS